MHTLNHGPLLQLRLRYTADTGRALVVHVFSLDASDATELFVAVPTGKGVSIRREVYRLLFGMGLLFPFGDQAVRG